MIKNILLTTFVFISLHHLIPAQAQEDPERETQNTLNFRKEQLLADSNKCTDKNNTVTCVLTSGCCWVEADVVLIGTIKGCISPGTSRDDSDFCHSLKLDHVPGYTKVSFC